MIIRLFLLLIIITTVYAWYLSNRICHHATVSAKRYYSFSQYASKADLESTTSYSSTSASKTSLGAPSNRPASSKYISKGGLEISLEVNEVMDAELEVKKLVDLIDNHKGKSSFFFLTLCASK